MSESIFYDLSHDDTGRALREAVEDATARGVLGIEYQVEQYIKLYVHPRPRLMPMFIYRWLMNSICVFNSLPVLTPLAGEEMRDEIAVAMTQRAEAFRTATGGRSAAN